MPLQQELSQAKMKKCEKLYLSSIRQRPSISFWQRASSVLEIKTEYLKWFERMCEYGFTEEIDYTPLILSTPITSSHLLITNLPAVT
jgi:hypothetical protein